MKNLMLLVASFCLSASSLAFATDPIQPNLESKARTLFEFSEQRSASQWRIVNDGVMGGRSQSGISIKTPGQMEFAGTLSLENNGGFASTRSVPKTMKLESGDTIVLEVRGDGRKYTFNAYVPRRRMAFSFRKEFQTVKDQWMEVEIPIDSLVATSFGRIVRGLEINPEEVNSIGILLGDKKPGPFQLSIRSIDVQSKTGQEF